VAEGLKNKISKRRIVMKDIMKIDSITQLHQALGFEKPTHPLITILDVSKWKIGKEWVGVKAVTSFYTIALKDSSCGLEYGRNSYDFGEGVLIFTAPNQVMLKNKEQGIDEVHGWMLFFHPDLIRNTALGKNIDTYNFFSYDVHEALHLSDAEQKILTDCIKLIETEITARIDNHSRKVIVSTLELLLNYSQRFYERQFNTRSAENKDVVSKFDRLLKEYYNDGKFTATGAPSLEYFAEQVHLSANYLSDLLKKETGYGAKDHINTFIVDRAKTLLLSDTDSISGVAYKLGFNYPHYFSRLFKAKTGMTPQEYRDTNEKI